MASRTARSSRRKDSAKVYTELEDGKPDAGHDIEAGVSSRRRRTRVSAASGGGGLLGPRAATARTGGSVWSDPPDEEETKGIVPTRGRVTNGRVVMDRSAVNQEEYSLAHVIKAGDDPYVYEGLQDGDDDVPWTPPAVGKAKTWRRVMTFEKGRASLRHTNVVNLMNLGPGNANYFLMLKYLAVGLLIMTVIAVLPMHLAHTGNGVIRMDDVNTARVTLGNAGIRPLVFVNTSNLVFPEGGRNPEQEQPRESASFFSLSFNQKEIAMAITYDDVVNTLAFLAIIIAFRIKNRVITRRSNESTVLTSAYAVMVHGLPLDATEGEIRRHFSDLFQLADPDWETPGCFCFCRKKPRLPQDMEDSGDVPGDKDVIEQIDPIDPCHPVADVSNAQDDAYLGSWVAEVSTVHRDTPAIRAYLGRQALTAKLHKVRALAKKYAVDTPYKSGPNARKKFNAMRKVEAYEKKMELLRSKQGGTSTQTVAAFVIFNNEESALRCVEDYARWRSFPSRLFQPTALRFRGQHVLLVEKAPEPEEILWENLETSVWEHLVRQFMAFVGMFLVVAASFFIVYQTLRIRGVLGEPDVIPAAEVCESHIPAGIYGQYLTIGNPQFTRRSSRYPFCADPSATLYLNLTIPDVETHAHPTSSLIEAGVDPLPTRIDERVVELSEERDEAVLLENVILATEFNITNVTLPLATDPCLGPCINPNDFTIPDPDPDDDEPAPTACVPLSCTPEGAAYERLGHDCTPQKYKPGLIVRCYCQQQLQHGINSDGLLQAAIDLRGGADGDICTTYAADFWWNETLPYIGMAALAFMNRVIAEVAVKLSMFERFASHKHRQVSVMLKVFVFQLINVGVLVPLVMFTPSGSSELWGLGGFMREGVWSAIESDWYPITGFYVTFLMVCTATLPHIVDLAHWIVVKPLQRHCCTQTEPTQMGLNRLHQGPMFDVSVRYGAALANIFAIAFFMVGLPLLLPIGVGLFGLQFWIDKLLLLRFYTKPPFLPSTLPDLVNVLLPWAVAFHFVGSIYLLSGPTLESGLFDFSSIFLASNKEDSDATVEGWQNDLSFLPFSLSNNVFKAHVFPIFALLLVYTVCLLLVQNFAKLLLRVFGKCMEYASCGLVCKRSAVNPDRRFVPPYTELFVRELNPRDEYELLPEEVLDGWVLETDSRSVQTLSKVWLADGMVQGIDHTKGSRKRTWEVLRDEAVHSYVISANPRYKSALSPAAPALTMSRGFPPPPRKTQISFGDQPMVVSPG